MISQAAFAKYASDPAAFRDDLLVDVDGSARRFGDVMTPWQRDDFAAIDPALTRCNGRASGVTENVTPKMRAYLERGRGSSKTTDLAVTCCWALAFAARPIRGYAFAADKDQADLLRDAMQTVVRLNPWLATILTVESSRVVNSAPQHPGEGGQLEIYTSDVGSSYGILPDLIVADELVHWEGDGSLWHSLISSAAKRSDCFLCVISNAGFVDSWAWQVREAARTDEAWTFRRLDGPPSWLTPARLAEQKRMLPQVAYLRLWENCWSSGGGDALTESDIKAAFIDGLEPFLGGEDEMQDMLFVAGVDLGLKRDSSALVILGVPEGGGAGRIRLCRHDVWKPTPGKKVNLSAVERRILEFDKQWGLEQVAFDPWQMEHLAQRLEADSGRRRRNQRRRFGSAPWMREVPPTGANLREQATLTIECFQDRRLALYPCEQLKRDLLKLRVEEKSYGIRLVSPRDGDGHGDLFSAFANALVIAHELAGKRPVRAGVVGLDDDDDDESPMDRAMRRVEEREERLTRRQARHEAAYRHVDEHQVGMLRALQATMGRSERHRGIRLPKWRGGW